MAIPEVPAPVTKTPYGDVEQNAVADTHLYNTTARNISWRGITVTVKDRETKQSKVIVDKVEGYVEAGEILALMGPSGCGKTTLLNVLASRPTAASQVEGSVCINGATPSRRLFRQMSRFVEQEDALTGSLTVRETLYFSSRLSISDSLTKRERMARVDGLLESFGLHEQANTIIGTPIRKGISGGQKRRVGIASQLITAPKILFLDEPTSGLDYVASFEVINYLKTVAKKNNLIVIASIHQPSTSTFKLFDKLMLLSGGKTHYFGPTQAVTAYYEHIGHPVPMHVNPAEFVLEQLNVDFTSNKTLSRQWLQEMQQAWTLSSIAKRLSNTVTSCETQESQQQQQQQQQGDKRQVVAVEKKPSFASTVLTLLHRSFIKSHRDVIAYGVRMGMYLGLAVLVGTVWVRLKTEQEYIQPFVNAIVSSNFTVFASNVPYLLMILTPSQFFGGAFMSFMAVAYVPAFLEDRAMYVKEFHNGLYGAAELIISNFIIGVPYLFIIALGFSSISYWLSNFNPTATAFFTWVMWLFLDLLAAEGLVVFLSSVAPNFVVALALVAFANGLWMCVNGFMVQPKILNVFYKYVFSYWDYQKYVFEGMMVNEFNGRNYGCGEGCQCMYQTELAGQCLVAGDGVLAQYGYDPSNLGRNVGIMIGIIAGYRVAAWLVLMVKR